MAKPILPILMICLAAASAADAQSGGGHGHGGRRGAPSSGGPPASANAPAPTPRSKPANQIEIIGVVRAITPDTDRITIAYEAVEALNWPAGAMPFVVAKPVLLQGVSVGEKVRFKIDSQQISELQAF